MSVVNYLRFGNDRVWYGCRRLGSDQIWLDCCGELDELDSFWENWVVTGDKMLGAILGQFWWVDACAGGGWLGMAGALVGKLVGKLVACHSGRNCRIG